MLKIRKFEKKDASIISKLIRRCLLEVNSKDYPQEIIHFAYEHYSSDKIIEKSLKRSVFVAVEEGNILGIASLEENVVYTVFVDPDFHGKGIGTKLMKYVEKITNDQGYESIKTPSSLTAFEFYERLGYQQVEVYHSNEWGKNILMEKSL